MIALFHRLHSAILKGEDEEFCTFACKYSIFEEDCNEHLLISKLFFNRVCYE